jgi:tetraacyldisaccharide 4'-kinase
VGNITLGGTGKTTFARFLAEHLRGAGHRVAVVLRGYGRAGRMERRVAHDGVRLLATAREVGDEAVMLATALGDVPVVAGADRVAAIGAAADLGAEVVILDDGLQHWRIAPHLAIALWDATVDPRAARLFPRGTLREPLTALRRADLVVLTRTDEAGDPGEIEDYVRSVVPTVPMVWGRHAPVAVVARDGSAEDAAALAGAPVFAVSSLGNPRALRMSLEHLGARVVGESVFRDHHLYTAADVESIWEAARSAGAKRILATEKDTVKLWSLPGAEGISALAVRFELVDAEGAGTSELPADRTLDALLETVLPTRVAP